MIQWTLDRCRFLDCSSIMKGTGSCASLQVMVELARVNAPIMRLFSEALETAEYNSERIIQNAKGRDYHEMIQNIRV